MTLLDLKSLNESIKRILKNFETSQNTNHLEIHFFQQWLELGRKLFELAMQTEIEKYESTLKGSHQKSIKSYHTRLGTIKLTRRLFKTQEYFEYSADKKFSLPSNGWLPDVQKLACIFGLETDFDNAASLLKETCQVEVTGKTLANQVEQLGAEMIAKRKNTPHQKIAERDSVLFKTVCKKLKSKPYVYVGMDGLMLSLNKKQGYKEALVGVIFWKNAHMPMSKKRKEVRHRHYIAMMDSKVNFVKEVFKSYSELVGQELCQAVVLADGARWIWDKVSEYYPDAIEILDFYHVSEYVWAAAHQIYPKNKKLRKAWVKRRLQSLKESKWKNVLKVLSKYPKHNGECKTPIGLLATYLYNNRTRIDYAHYLKLGLMIGSGVVESSNRRVVSQRLKRSGMHWSKQGANSVMALRAAYLSSDLQWQNFWEKRYAA